MCCPSKKVIKRDTKCFLALGATRRQVMRHFTSNGTDTVVHTYSTRATLTSILIDIMGACHYLTNRFQMKAPVAPSRSLREAFKRAPRSLRGACLREGFAEPPRRHHEPFAEVYEPFAEVAHTEGSTKTPWRVHEASSKGPWMNCMFLLDHDDCNRVWSILYCF